MIRLLLLLVVLAAVGIYVTRLLETRRRERLAVLRAAFLLGAREARGRVAELKDVGQRGGAVLLRVPRHWSEEYRDGGHASFRDPARPERVLTVSAATVETPPGDLASALRLQAPGETAQVEELGPGRALLRSLATSRVQGRDVVVFRWLLATSVAPCSARLISFAFSVPEKTATDPLTRDDVAVLDTEVRAAHVA